MKKITLLLGIILLSSCSSTQYVDSWKNREITVFKPNKLLVIGMTNNLTGRKIFEEKLSNAFVQRGINSFESMGVIDNGLDDSSKTETEIEAIRDKLVDQGFDAVAITAVIGIDEREEYRPGHYYYFPMGWYGFRRYFFRYQGMYYDPGYYENYRVYHIETSIYSLKADEDKSLIWVGSFNIADPIGITATVNDYVARIMRQLEKEKLVVKID